MRTTRLGDSNLTVSEFCLGTMMFGGKTPADEAVRIVQRAFDAGVNFIDTADCYNAGKAEEITGKAIGEIRDRVVLASKVGVKMGDGPNDGGASRYHIINGVEASLRRLATDRIDLLYIHWPFEQLNLEELLRAMEDLVRAGKILYVGCSNFPAWLLVRSRWIQDIRGYLPFTAGQFPYNLLERGLEVEMLPAAEAIGVGFVTYRPLCTGLLTGKYIEGAPKGSRGSADNQVGKWQQEYDKPIKQLVAFARERDLTPADVAINWVCSQRAITSAIIGISRMEQLESNLKSFEWTMNAEDREELTRAFPTEVKEAAWGSFPGWRRSFDITS